MINEDFDMSGMSDTDWTDTFADADNNAVIERIADIKKWVSCSMFQIDWNKADERTQNFIDDIVKVTAENDGYHMSVYIPDDDFVMDLGCMNRPVWNLFKSLKINNGETYTMPDGSSTGVYPYLTLDKFDCFGYGEGELDIRIDTKQFKWSDLTPCFRVLDSTRELMIGSFSSANKLKIDSLAGFPTIRGVNDFVFRLNNVKYKSYSNPAPFPVFFNDVVKNIRICDTDPAAPSMVRIMVDYDVLSNPVHELDIYDGVFNQNYNNYLKWNGAPNYIRYMTWDMFRKYVRNYAKPATHEAMEHLIDGWEKMSDIGTVFTVNDNNSFHSDTPWTTCVARADGTYYVMDPEILERMTNGQWKRLSPLV